MRTNWKIYINYGTKEEIEKIDALVFPSKKEASAFARENKYPQKCVVSENTWKEWKGSKETICVKK